MRLLMTTDTVGGVWTYALDLCRALASEGVEILLAAMGPDIAPHQRDAAGALGNVELVFRRSRLEWMEDPWDDVDAAGEWLLGLAADHRPALVHCNMFAQGALPFDVPTLVVGHSCVCSWFRAVRGRPAPKRFDTYRRRVAAGLQAASVVVAPSAWMRSQLQREYGAFGSIEVIHNGRDPSLFRPLPKEDLILASGRLWDDAKNAATLARAAASLPWRVCIAGDVSHPSGTSRSFPGAQVLGALPPPELAELMGRASIYALPVRYEPFGLSILEAAFCGCALVLGDTPSLRELWGDAAVFVPPLDRGALTFAIERLIADPYARDTLARRAGRRAKAFTAARMGAAYQPLYRHLVSTQGHTSTPPLEVAVAGGPTP